ncbi:MAG: hypothetical protein O7J95_07470 [Planctomycetota bacterium]|nr:hypothetical protein [Planctomycetota bacterium]
MRHLTHVAVSWLAAVSWTALSHPPLAAQDRREVDLLREEMDDLRRRVDRLSGDEDDAADPDPKARLPGYKGGLHDKPFLERAASRVSISGYFDVEYRDAENQPHDFRFHRLIPFIYVNIHERLRFASEVEIEDGSQVEVEFAYFDVLLLQQANLRAGVILDPLGKFNLIHDSPINDLTDRPLVNQSVIPTTLREIGVGLFGSLTPPTSAWEVKYEAYLTSGFKGLDNTGSATISASNGLRDARPHKDVLGTRNFGDVNNKFAGVGRLSVSPLLGSEFGISAHTGAYDEAGDNNLTTGALDGLITIPRFDVGEFPVGPVEIQGEGAFSFVERDSFARASGVAGDLWGYYVQVNYHFMPRWLADNVPLFFHGSTFTLVGRWDQVDLDSNRQRRLTIGLNYRPIESAAFKIDYQFNRGTGTAPASKDDDALVISLTSYF